MVAINEHIAFRMNLANDKGVIYWLFSLFKFVSELSFIVRYYSIAWTYSRITKLIIRIWMKILAIMPFHKHTLETARFNRNI